MATLNPVQLAQVTYKAGWRGLDWVRAIAIAMAESGGNTQAYNPESQSPYAKPGGGSRGIFQIFTSVHPEFSGMDLSDPQQNANAAFQLYKRAGNRFGDWTTYTGGAYNKYLSTAAAAAQSTTGAVASMAGKATGDLGNAIGSAITTAATAKVSVDWTPVITGALTSVKNTILGKSASGEQREGIDAAFFVGGLVLVLVGLIALFMQTEPGKRVVAMGGEAAKLAITKV